MTVVNWWRTGDTRPAVLIPLYLGEDPLTGEARTIQETDTMSMIMRNGNAETPVAQVIDDLEVVELDPPRVDPATNAETSQALIYKPEDGDLDEAGLYDLVFQLTDTDGDVETIPDRESVSYQFLIGAKPGDEDA